MVFNIDLLTELNLHYVESSSNLRDKEINNHGIRLERDSIMSFFHSPIVLKFLN
jgi:hypothetical protein